MNLVDLILLILLFSVAVFFMQAFLRPYVHRTRGVLLFRRGLVHDARKLPVPALACWREAAELGSADAQAKLGWLHFHGLHVPQDDKSAAVWSRKAAEHGHVPAQALLGYLYSTGRGVPEDQSEALFWLTLALLRGRNDEVQRMRTKVAAGLPASQRVSIENRARHWLSGERTASWTIS